MQLVKFAVVSFVAGCEAYTLPTVAELSKECNPNSDHPVPQCAASIAKAIVDRSRECFDNSADEAAYSSCARNFCGRQCGVSKAECQSICVDHSLPLFAKLEARAHTTSAPSTTTAPPAAVTSAPSTTTAPPAATTAAATTTVAAASQSEPAPVSAAPTDATPDEEQVVNSGSLAQMNSKELMTQAKEAAGEEAAAMSDLQEAQDRMRRLNAKIKARGEKEIKSGNAAHGRAELEKVSMLSGLDDQIDLHLANVAQLRDMARSETGTAEADPVPDMSNGLPPMEQPSFSFLQKSARSVRP